MAIMHISESNCKALNITEIEKSLSVDRVAIPTGFTELDNVLKGGFRNCELTVIAGREGQGRSTLATNIAVNIAKYDHSHYSNDRSVFYISLRMSAPQLSTRILAAETHIPLSYMKDVYKCTDKDFIKMSNCSYEISKLPLYVDDTEGLTISDIKQNLNTKYKEIAKNINLIVIDNLQILAKNSSLSEEDTLKELRFISRDRFVSILVVSDLPQKPETIDDNTPKSEDFHEIDIVDNLFFVYRQYYYLVGKDVANMSLEEIHKLQRQLISSENKAEIICAKVKYNNQKAWIIRLLFNGDCCLYSNLPIKE